MLNQRPTRPTNQGSDEIEKKKSILGRWKIFEF